MGVRNKKVLIKSYLLHDHPEYFDTTRYFMDALYTTNTFLKVNKTLLKNLNIKDIARTTHLASNCKIEKHFLQKVLLSKEVS